MIDSGDLKVHVYPPLPSEPIEVWVGALAQPAIRRTARLADGWLATPGASLKTAGDQLNRYRQACAEYSREPTATAIRRDIYLASTSQAAAKRKAEFVAQGYRGFPEDALMVGSVTEVVDQLAAFTELGYTDVIVRNISQDQPEALTTIELLADVKRQL